MAEHAVVVPVPVSAPCSRSWLEADGDQVLFDVEREHGENPPVFYYGHEKRPAEVRRVAGRFTEWVEGLPRSGVFG